MALNVDQLKDLVAGDTVAIRGTATLEPAGGPGDKIFPPTHAVDDKKKPDPGAKYAFETRRINGENVRCVLIDSVQSQANRMEEALQALWADKHIALPVVSVDFSSIAPEVGRRLFEQFFTTKPQGSGIGLALSRQIAEAHGGTLALENRTPDKGCRATLRLPL